MAPRNEAPSDDRQTSSDAGPDSVSNDAAEAVVGELLVPIGCSPVIYASTTLKRTVGMR